jgi:hypothetical protein
MALLREAGLSQIGDRLFAPQLRAKDETRRIKARTVVFRAEDVRRLSDSDRFDKINEMKNNLARRLKPRRYKVILKMSKRGRTKYRKNKPILRQRVIDGEIKQASNLFDTLDTDLKVTDFV